jgi:hypothetical protein
MTINSGMLLGALCICAPTVMGFTQRSESEPVRQRESARPRPTRILHDGRLMTTFPRGTSRAQARGVGGGGASRELGAETGSRGGNQPETSRGSGDPNRRHPGSLLLLPEFDNRDGAATVYTVTNTHPTEPIDVEFVYLGRYGPRIDGDVFNGDFSMGGAGWTVEITPPQDVVPGSVVFDNGYAAILEGSSFLTSFHQTFPMPEGAKTLEFDIFIDPGFDLDGVFIPDAFEAQLLDGAMQSVVPTWTLGATSYFNLQEDLTANLGSTTSYIGTRVSVDVSNVPVGTPVTLFFDFIGADDDYDGGVKIADVHLSSGAPNDLGCLEFNRTEHLTPNDTITLLTEAHNPQAEQGFAYAFARNSGGEAVSFNHLIGSVMAIDGLQVFSYSINAVLYESPLVTGELTDLDADGVRDMNGSEYDQTPGSLLIPRFIGQGVDVKGWLILVALSGGTSFDTILDFLVYNDNEEVFSTEYEFFCWDRVPLLEISSLFGHEFLADWTSHDSGENLGGLETGWFRIDGHVASSSTHSISDPAFYAVYIESVTGKSAADLPFELSAQDGHLLPTGLDGDNEE